MIKSGRSVNANSYQDMMNKAFGPTGSIVCGLFQVIFALGCMCAYLLIIADNLTRVIGYYLPGSILGNRSLLVFFGSTLLIFPLSVTKDVTFLGKVASFSVVSNFLIVLAVLLQKGSIPRASLNETFKLFKPNIVEAIGVISFSFVCHHNTFLIRESLETKSTRLFSVVTTLSITFSLLISMCLSIPSYMHFSSLTDANILNNFDQSNRVINFCRLLFAMSLYVTFPLDCYVARDVIIRSVFTRASVMFPFAIHTGVTAMIVSLTTAIVLMYKDLGECLEITGGVSASALAFILPAAAFLKLTSGCNRTSLEKTLARMLFTFGCIVLILSLAMPLSKVLTHKW